MNVTNVYTRNLEAFVKARSTKAIIENRGGQGSSKTMSVLQCLYTICSESKKKRLVTVASYALPHLKAGAMADFDKILHSNNIDPTNVKLESKSKYILRNSEIEFVGIEGNEARVTGPRRDILYINELNNRIKYDVFDLMNSRTHEATFVDYNPRSQFWLQEKVNVNFPYIEIVSTFLDNPYLPDREVQNILMKKDKPGFENWWKVYGLGQFGSYEGSILTNWKYGEYEQYDLTGAGLDFGVKDPDALVRVSIDKKQKRIYCKELIYKSGNSTDDLISLLYEHSSKNEFIVADSQALRTINDIYEKGFNIHSMHKNKIIEDIKLLRDYELILSYGSTNLAKELNQWVWLDKKGEIPIDESNHLIDALRYIVSTLLKPNKKKGHKLLA